jgi:hypothetical protein
MQPRTDPPIKVVLIGNPEKKKAFMRDLSQPNSYQTIAVDFKLINYNNCQFEIWDAAGQERFFKVLSITLINAQAIVYIYPTQQQRETVSNKIPPTAAVIDYDPNGTPFDCLQTIQDTVSKLQTVQDATHTKTAAHKKGTPHLEHKDHAPTVRKFHKAL